MLPQPFRFMRRAALHCRIRLPGFAGPYTRPHELREVHPISTSRSAPTRNAFLGKWRITQMDAYDADYFDMEVPAYIALERGQRGEFQFGAVSGTIDYRRVKRDGAIAIEFTWDGQDEMDPMTGRGWAALTDGQLAGRIFTHQGDDSSFVARRLRSRPK